MLLNWHPVYPGADYAGDHAVLLAAFESRDPNAADAARDHLTLSLELILQETKRYAERLAAADRLADGGGPPGGEPDKETTRGATGA